MCFWGKTVRSRLSCGYTDFPRRSRLGWLTADADADANANAGDIADASADALVVVVGGGGGGGGGGVGCAVVVIAVDRGSVILDQLRRYWVFREM